jgi:hypothetical protein
MLYHHKIFRECVQKGKEMVRTGEERDKIGRRYYSALAQSALFKGDTKQRRVILTLMSLYMEQETRSLL